MESPEHDSELARLGPVARMMIAVAGHAITSHIHLRALVELLVNQGIVDREALEAQFNLMRIHELDATIDEWFPPDIAMHLKEAAREHGPQPDHNGGPPSADSNNAAPADD